ncbi:MAG: hypothetical protein JJU32_19580 [Phormidium sp. BM_Day4_Bin.17]|nr:hypothetical protein [Phormidium sp. BM_Day4_Bin.17]UCJ13445.1 MAG: hypothetical protein JWS08_06675 [Phormidium sp. PBR-2020]
MNLSLTPETEQRIAEQRSHLQRFTVTEPRSIMEASSFCEAAPVGGFLGFAENDSGCYPPKISDPGEKAIAVLLWQVACEYLAASRKLELLR